MSDTTTSLAGKIARASIAMGNFSADKKNQDQNYAYVSADQVLSRGGDALAQQGVAIFPALAGVELNSVERQGKAPRLDARVSFSMTVTDGSTEMVMPWFGFGSDYATPDKAVYKAITSGHKYFLMKLLNIGIGNEDGEHETPPAAAAKRDPNKNPDPPSEKARDAWGSLCVRAEKVDVPYPQIEFERITMAELRSAYKELEGYVLDAEDQAKAVN